MLLSQFLLTFLQICKIRECSFCVPLEVFHKWIPLNSILLLLFSSFRKGCKFQELKQELMYNISIIASIRSSPSSRFWATCAAYIAYWDLFVFFYQNDRSSKGSSDRLVFVVKRFLKQQSLPILIKQKSLTLCRN